ncbi:MAG: DUF5615 family PIN-like protein [Phycisphaerales bacterium]|nr:DUF5615 family PIN-like protein [Phycisphaerales bacterium]
MRLLADENVDHAVVEWLRSRPLDVAWIAELDPGASDQSVGALAILEARVLITFDRDFGEMVSGTDFDFRAFCLRGRARRGPKRWFIGLRICGPKSNLTYLVTS